MTPLHPMNITFKKWQDFLALFLDPPEPSSAMLVVDVCCEFCDKKSQKHVERPKVTVQNSNPTTSIIWTWKI